MAVSSSPTTGVTEEAAPAAAACDGGGCDQSVGILLGGSVDRWSSIRSDCSRWISEKKSSSGTVGAGGGWATRSSGSTERWSSRREPCRTAAVVTYLLRPGLSRLSGVRITVYLSEVYCEVYSVRYSEVYCEVYSEVYSY